jgi:hypothetical protein
MAGWVFVLCLFSHPLCRTPKQISKFNTSLYGEDFNEWSHASTPACVYMGWCLIKHKVYFISVYVIVPVTPIAIQQCFWDVTAYNLVEVRRYFGRTSCPICNCGRPCSSRFFIAIAMNTGRACDNYVWFISDHLLISKNLFVPFLSVPLTILRVTSHRFTVCWHNIQWIYV